MKKRIVEVLVLIAVVAVASSALKARFGSVGRSGEEVKPLVLPSPEQLSIGGIFLGMSEADARARLGEVREDENSGYRWTLGRGEICETFYIHDGKVMAVTGTRLDYESAPYLGATKPVSDATTRLGNVSLSYDIPGYGALCYSRIGLIVGTDSGGNNLMERFTLLPVGSELEMVSKSWWNGRNPRIAVAAPLNSEVLFCVGYPDWREFENERIKQSGDPTTGES